MKTNTLVFAGGCFWGVQAYAKRLPGVVDTVCGYVNGTLDSPTYEQVCSGQTGHAEAVKIIFNQEQTSIYELTKKLYSILSLTTSSSSQYRYGFYYIVQEDGNIIDNFLEMKQHCYNTPIIVECEPLRSFFDAEKCHQDYLDHHPDAFCHIDLSGFEN